MAKFRHAPAPVLPHHIIRHLDQAPTGFQCHLDRRACLLRVTSGLTPQLGLAQSAELVHYFCGIPADQGMPAQLNKQQQSTGKRHRTINEEALP